MNQFQSSQSESDEPIELMHSSHSQSKQPKRILQQYDNEIHCINSYRNAKKIGYPNHCHIKVPAFGNNVLISLSITVAFTQLANLLPGQLLFLSLILHFLDFIFVWLVIIVGSFNTNQKQSSKSQNSGRYRKQSWHALLPVFIYKFISVISSHNTISIFHDNITLKILSTILIYSTYIHATGLTTLNYKIYLLVVVTCFVMLAIHLIYFYAGQNDWLFYIERDCKFEAAILFVYFLMMCIFKTLRNKKMQIIQKPTVSIINYPKSSGKLKQLVNRLKNVDIREQYPSVFNCISKNQPSVNIFTSPRSCLFQYYISMVWLVTSVLMTVCLVFHQCRQYMHWIALWIMSVTFGSGNNHSVAYLKSRYHNIVFVSVFILVSQYCTYFLVYHGDQLALQTVSFHFNNFVSLIIVDILINLQAPQLYVSNISRNQIIKALFLLPTPNIAFCKDKFYKISVQALSFIVQSLVIICGMLAYKAFSDNFYYLHSRQTNSNALQSNCLQGQQKIQRVVETMGLGYAIFVCWIYYCWRFIRDLELAKQDRLDASLLIRQIASNFATVLVIFSWVLLISSSINWGIPRLLLTSPSIEEYYSLSRLIHYRKQSIVPKPQHLILLLQVFITASHALQIFRRNAGLMAKQKDIINDQVITKAKNFVQKLCLILMLIAAHSIIYWWRCVRSSEWIVLSMSAFILVIDKKLDIIKFAKQKRK